MQKPIGGRSVLAVSTTKSMLKTQAAAGKQKFKLFKREGVYSPSTSLSFCNMFN
jgi:hypothetical protein